MLLGDGRELLPRRWQMRRDGANHHQKLGHKEFCVRVNIPSPTWQVQFPMQSVIEPICGLLHRMWHVSTLISDTCSYPPHRCHVYSESLSSSSTTLPSLQKTKLSHHSLFVHGMILSCHRVQCTPSEIYTENSIHRWQYTLSAASTNDPLCFLHSQDYELTPECSVSFRCASRHDWPHSASFTSGHKGKVTLSYSHVC